MSAAARAARRRCPPDRLPTLAFTSWQPSSFSIERAWTQRRCALDKRSTVGHAKRAAARDTTCCHPARTAASKCSLPVKDTSASSAQAL